MKGKIVYLTLALALVFSLAAAIVPASPARADPDGCWLWGVTGAPGGTGPLNPGAYSQVFLVDTATGAVIMVNNSTSNPLYGDIAMTPNGNLYTTGANDYIQAPDDRWAINFNDFYRLDPFTGAVIGTWSNAFTDAGFERCNALAAVNNATLYAIEGGGVCTSWGYATGPRLLQINLDASGNLASIISLGTLPVDPSDDVCTLCSDGDLDRDPLTGDWYAGFWEGVACSDGAGSGMYQVIPANPGASARVSQSGIQYEAGFAFCPDGSAWAGSWADKKLYSVNVLGGGSSEAHNLSGDLAGNIYGLSPIAEIKFLHSDPLDPPPLEAFQAIMHDPVCTQWHELFPVYCNEYHLTAWQDTDLDGCLCYSDQIQLQDKVTGETACYHVEFATVTYLVDGMYIESVLACEDAKAAMADPVGTLWHEVWPNFCTMYLLTGWMDTNPGGLLDPCDSIYLKDIATGEGVGYCHVDAMALDIVVTPKCGDDVVDPWCEECDPPAANSVQCPQTDFCDGPKRCAYPDAYGDCVDCQCVDDTPTCACAKDLCGATCAVDADCPEGQVCADDCQCQEEAPATPTPPPSRRGGGGGFCFIATAAYGSYLDSHVQTLRDFRDQYLETNPVGSALVSAYYELSPPVAEFIDDHPSLKPIVRAGLMPAVAMSTVAVNTTLAEKIAMVSGLALVSLALGIWLRRRAARKMTY